MAIRIDLLPGYVGLKRWFKRIAAGCALLVAVFAAALYLLYYKEQLALQTLQTNRDNIKKYADMADAAKAAADAATTKAKPLQDAVNFMVDAGRTGSERAALLDLVRRYVYANAVVGAIDLSDGQTAKMTVLVRNPDEYARFLLNLRRGATPTGVLFADLPTGSGINGWPSVSGGASGGGGGGAGGGVPAPGGAPGGEVGGGQASNNKDNDPNVLMQKIFNNKIDVSAKLREPVVIPTPPGAAAAPAGGGGAPGMPGGPGDPGMPPAPPA
jgi:hypothetical protein